MGSMIVSNQRIILIPENKKDTACSIPYILCIEEEFIKRFIVKDYYTGKVLKTDDTHESFEYRVVFRGGGYTKLRNVIQECSTACKCGSEFIKGDFDFHYWNQFNTKDDDPSRFFDRQPDII